MDWTDDAIDQLKALWSEGHSTAEIGRRMNGITKNAVVGKAHRLGLPARPSPIRRDEEAARPRAPKRVVGPTLPPIQEAGNTPSSPVKAPIPSPAAASVAVLPAPSPSAVPRLVVARPPVTAGLKPVKLQEVAARQPRRMPTCCWPIGEPGTASFRFCDQDADAGRAYCGEHVQLAYVRVRDRKEDVA